MHHQRRVEFVRQLARGLEIGVVVGIDGVRGHGWNDGRVALVLVEKLRGGPQHILGRGEVGRFEADHGLAQNAAHAGFFRGFGDAVLEIIHVDERGGAGEHHFEARQARAPQDEIGRYVLGLGRKDEFVEPVLHHHVVGDAAEQRHGGVGVRVDQPRHQNGIRAVEVLARLKLLFDIGALSDANDALAANGDRAVVDQVAARIHGDHVAGGVDGVGRLGVENEGRKHQA